MEMDQNASPCHSKRHAETKRQPRGGVAAIRGRRRSAFGQICGRSAQDAPATDQ